MTKPDGRTMVRALFLSASLAAISAPAIAQEAQQPANEQETGDIVVVAQGRAQLLSDVPVAVSAVSAETLANSGANDIRQINQVAPSLLVSSSSSEANGSARIRGIGTVGDNPGLESSVIVLIDGVYRSRSGIGLNELGEIERVEVLRGPQGTLGGRNSSAGLISIYSKKPEFEFGGTAEASYGNYDYFRLGGSITGPLSENVAARLDGIYVKRDGFLLDPGNNGRLNNRDRYFLRGQLLFEPTDALTVRIIGDYTKRNEDCCGAIYIDRTVNEFVGGLNDPAVPLNNPNGNNIVNVLRDLGQNISRLNPGYTRVASVTPGRDYASNTRDFGGSFHIDYDLGGAKLTSITAYRDYRALQGQDADFSTVDILYRAGNGNSQRRFRTFTQELRLQGEAFGGHLDWLIGGFYANEKLRLLDNLRFGAQYGRFATCRLISGGALAGVYSPASQSCIAPPARPVVSGAFGAAGPLILAAIDRLDTLNDRGSSRDVYNQKDENWALFTHNIIHLTNSVDVTLGLRYTKDMKDFSASFTNDNTVCTANQASIGALLANTALAPTVGAILGLSCQGNSSAELNGVSIRDSKSEDEFSGTAVLSWRPTDDLMTYVSYSRGYKAGGFNLDRSALKNPIVSFASTGGAQARTPFLKFEPETVNAYEIGAKYQSRMFSMSAALFRQDFRNFQLNTFDGTVFVVQTINGCSTDLGTTDSDTSAATGACAPGDLTWGVRTEGVELEATLVPARNLRVGLGFTYANTRYNDDVVGSNTGAPLTPALRKLPGDNLSNAPRTVTTGSLTWTPEIGTSGLSGLFYIDARMTGDYNTGSDLFPQKEQDSYTIVNARVGIRGAEDRWSLEFWAQNLFNVNYAQVAFNSPFQSGGASAAYTDPQYPGGRQIFSQFLAEPRTYGITLRGSF